MVIWWPPVVASALAGGVAAGFLGVPGWARMVVAAKKSPAHTMRGFMGDSPPQRFETAGRCNGNDCRTTGSAWGRLVVPTAMMRAEHCMQQIREYQSQGKKFRTAVAEEKPLQVAGAVNA